MKKVLFSAVLACGFAQSMNAQVIDTVIVGNGYANNIWYSLQDDNQASQPANNWDIALATTISPTNGLASAALFNYKSGTLYAIPGSNPANFETVDTTGMVAAGALYNSDTTWARGAFNRTPVIGQYDYGWGTYDNTTHSGIAANRVFVIKYANGSYKKLIINLSFSAGYTVKFANLDNTGLVTATIPMSTYSTKNFVYYSLTNNQIIDREPVSANWDFTFLQYNTDLGGGMMYPVAGLLQNQGVQVATAYPVNNPTTYTTWSAHTFSNKINTIGYDWKNTGPGGVVIEDSTVYFVKAKNGDLWKVIMTGFISGASGNGSYIFSKQKLSTASVEDIAADVFMSIYPNPAAETATVVIDSKSASTVAVYNTLGALVYSTDANNGLQTVNIPVAQLQNGIYHVVCASNGTKTTQKLMVQH